MRHLRVSGRRCWRISSGQGLRRTARSFPRRQTSLVSARAGFLRVRNRFARPLWFLFALVALLLVVAAASAANLPLARGAARRRRSRWPRPRRRPGQAGAADADRVDGADVDCRGRRAADRAMGRRLAAGPDDHPGAGHRSGRRHQRPHRAVLAGPRRDHVGAVCSNSCVPCHACGSACGLKAATGTLRTFGSGLASGRTIVAAQVAVSVPLLASATLFARSLYGVLSLTAGVDRKLLVVTADAAGRGYEDERAAAFYQQLLERVRNVPGVAAAAISGCIRRSVAATAPGRRTPASTARLRSRTRRRGVFQHRLVWVFRTTGMTLLRGRDIADGDNQTAMRVAVVNEALVRRFFPGQDPIGRQITIGRDKSRQNLQIVGVVSTRISAAPGGAAQRGVSAVAPAADREHVPRAARRLAVSRGRGGPSRGARHRRGRAGAPADGRRAHPRVARHRARAGDARRTARRARRRRWRAPGSTACWLTPSPARRARSACAWRSAHTRAP